MNSKTVLRYDPTCRTDKGHETHLTSIRDMKGRMISPNIYLTGTPERKWKRENMKR